MSESFAPLEFGFAGTACGWGPPHGSIPESKANIAAVYSPFDKSKLIGRAVDVTGRRRYYNRGGDEEAAAASQQLSKPPLPVDFAAEAALAGAVGEADLSGGRPADAAYFTFNGRCFITFFTKSRWILGELG